MDIRRCIGERIFLTVSCFGDDTSSIPFMHVESSWVVGLYVSSETFANWQRDHKDQERVIIDK